MVQDDERERQAGMLAGHAMLVSALGAVFPKASNVDTSRKVGEVFAKQIEALLHPPAVMGQRRPIAPLAAMLNDPYLKAIPGRIAIAHHKERVARRRARRVR